MGKNKTSATIKLQMFMDQQKKGALGGRYPHLFNRLLTNYYYFQNGWYDTI